MFVPLDHEFEDEVRVERGEGERAFLSEIPYGDVRRLAGGEAVAFRLLDYETFRVVRHESRLQDPHFMLHGQNLIFQVP
jgi:hypothetical protein